MSVLGIDASNLRAGGGLTHLVELLRAADPLGNGFTHVIVWGNSFTLAQLEDKSWLNKVTVPIIERSLPFRLYWQRSMLHRSARAANCDLLFVPGGSYRGLFQPFVTMSRSLLPFEKTEVRRYGPSWTAFRLMLLRWSQARTFGGAEGVIFLTHYARDVVIQTVAGLSKSTVVIPHGVHERFFLPPREQKAIDAYSSEQPFRVVYVSIVNLYKHQWHVAEAVAQLRRAGFPVQLDLIGPAHPAGRKRLRGTLRRLDPGGSFLRYRGRIPYVQILHDYHSADLFVFASSCETFGQILTEAMASGLPIACSNRSSMSETLGDAGVYFDPENPTDIADALAKYIESPSLRAEKAILAYSRARAYTWRRCARDTFAFLASFVHADGQRC